jgi:hypothetical protein
MKLLIPIVKEHQRLVFNFVSGTRKYPVRLGGLGFDFGNAENRGLEVLEYAFGCDLVPYFQLQYKTLL